MDETLSRLQKLYREDQQIKKEMIEISPPVTGLNTEGVIDYVNQVHRDLKDIFFQLKDLSKTFSFGSEFDKKIESLEQETLRELYKCGANINKLRNFYQTKITSMKQSFLDSVKRNCIGYYLWGKLGEPLQEVSTINEMLHLIHSAIINEKDFLQSCNPITSKNNNHKGTITAYGYPSEFLQNIYNSFSTDLDVGDTTMVGINEKQVLMMIRDRGHALTMELRQGNAKTSVDYFIPKICSVKMVNELPGVNPVKDYSVGTTGFFDFPNEELYQITDFIEMVPTDDDTIRERQERENRVR